MNIKNFNYSYLFDAQTEYYLTDHLGSIRTTIDQNGAVIGFDDYDPFGNVLPGRSYNLGTPNDLNKFTGHERDQEGGLDLDYMLARNYDSELGRFYSIDPFSFIHSNYTPYHYVLNNPMKFIDPFGLDTTYTAVAENINVISTRIYTDNYGGINWNEMFGGLIGLERNTIEKYGSNLNASLSFMTQYSSKYLEMQIGSRAKYPNVMVSLRPKIFSNYRAIGQTVPQIFLKSSTAWKIASGLGKVSTVTGVLGIGLTGYQTFTGEISPLQGSVEGVLGVVGFIWPVGTGISVAYFGGKLAYEYFNETTIEY